MRSKEQLRKEIQRLSKARPFYQYVEVAPGVFTKRKEHGKALRRTEPFTKWVKKYVEEHHEVIDIGCCSGLYSLTAAEVCKSAMGVDIDRNFINQARWLHGVWKEKTGLPLENVSFHTLDINKRTELLQRSNFMIAAKVLYHWDFKAGIHGFMRHVKKSPIKTILAQGHTTRGRFGTTDGMKFLFKSYGFAPKLLENVREYPIVIAQR